MPKRTRYKEIDKTRLHRLEAWNKLSPKQKLEALDFRLGKDEGAVRQRIRLMKELGMGITLYKVKDNEFNRRNFPEAVGCIFITLPRNKEGVFAKAEQML